MKNRNTATIVMSPLGQDENLREDALKAARDVQLKRCDLLSKAGYSPKILTLADDAHQFDQTIYYGYLLEEARPGSTLAIEAHTPVVRHMLSWPRDGFQRYDDLLMYERRAEPFPAQIHSMLGVDGYRYQESDLGIGGYVVRDGLHLIFSEEVKNSPDIQTLKKLGFHISFLPIETSGPLTLEMPDKHIDCIFNIASAKDGHTIAVVNEEYRGEFERSVNKVVQQLKAELFTVKGEDVARKVINFADLPGGKIMIPNKCEETQQFLADHLGKENILVTELGDPWLEYGGRDGGGLRCRTNTLPAPKPQKRWDIDKL